MHEYVEFHHRVEVAAGDTLWSIAKGLGHSTPGPIVASPLNGSRFVGRSADQVRPGDVVFVPWPVERLREFLGILRESRARLCIGPGP